MDTTDIERFIRNDRMCRGIFQGVFSVDTLPENPRLLICNTDPSTKPGKHWIAIFIDKNGRGEFFDSFGRRPSNVFVKYMNENCTDWFYNARQLQNISSIYCGFYCCFYCMLRCRGYDLNYIVNIFTRDTRYNDRFVHGFVCSQ